MKKLIFVLVLLIIVLGAGLSAQSNDVIDTFLDAEVADVGTTLLLIGQSTSALGSDAGAADGYNWGKQQKFGKRVEKLRPDEPISLGLFYLALFESHEIKGGLMYSAARTPRYAAMEAAYKGYVESSRLYYTRSMPPFEVLTALGEIENE